MKDKKKESFEIDFDDPNIQKITCMLKRTKETTTKYWPHETRELN